MLILTLAASQITSDTSLIKRHVRLLSQHLNFSPIYFIQYGMFRSWANYLVNNTLHPGSQWVFQRYWILHSIISLCHRTTADSFSFQDETNLALKGIIAIAAMANMSTIVGSSTDQQSYQVSSLAVYLF